jgi:GDPmannose 4,6-dehydratase
VALRKLRDARSSSDTADRSSFRRPETNDRSQEAFLSEFTTTLNERWSGQHEAKKDREPGRDFAFTDSPSPVSHRALIVGIAGQDGSLLAELLLDEGYEVFGVVRRSPSESFPNLATVRDKVELLQADVLDQMSLIQALEMCRPREVYNLASPSFVPKSWEQPVLTAEFAAVGATALLEAIRVVDPSIRFYQASSSEIFGDPEQAPQTERTPVAPVTPYGVAKAYAHFITRSYRRRYGLHASSGILFNHESPRRPLDFLPRKVAHAAASVKLGLQRDVSLGALDARRDWGFAGDYVRAMWLMLQQEQGDDYVIATGESHSVRELAAAAFERVDLDWRDHVHVDPLLQRGSAELHNLVGDATKARDRLGWRPALTFSELVNLLVDADLARLGRLSEARAAAIDL